MATKNIRRLKPTNNELFLDAIRNEYGSPEYQARIPEATKAGIADTVSALNKFTPLRNEFIDALVNRIAIVEALSNSWENPLREFKRGMLTFGDTIEQTFTDLIQSKTYEPDREHMEKDIFGTHRPNVQSQFHKVNREEYYPLTVNEALLNRAFLEPQGLSSFASTLFQAQSTSDNLDEWLVTCRLFAEYGKNGGYYKINVPDMSELITDPAVSEANAKHVLKIIRAMSDTLGFMSTKYNSAHMHVSAKADELVLFATPNFIASLDVDALAGAFNLDRANVKNRIIPVPKEQFGMDECQAILTTRDFFVIADTKYESTSQWNPVSLQNNYFLHHWQIVSCSRFAPAIMFTTGEGTPDPIKVATPVTSVSAITLTDRDEETVTDVVRGEYYNVLAEAVTTPAGGDNNAVLFSLLGQTSDLTTITHEGVLKVGGDEESDSITIFASSMWVNEDNVQEAGKTNSVTVTVTGETFPAYPNTYPAWVKTTAYVLGDKVILADGEVLEVTTAGTSGSTAPVAPEDIGDSVTDGTVVWNRIS